MMQRRHLIKGLFGLGQSAMLLGLLGYSSVKAQPRFSVTQEQVQQVLVPRFPRRYPIAGLLDLSVQLPALQLLPAENRVRANMLVDATGAALQRKQTGTLEMDFALRYEPTDRSIRATKLRFRRLYFAGLLPAVSELLNRYGQQMSEQLQKEVVLHQLRPQDTAMMDNFGMQPDSITVTETGLVFVFAAKP